jgi:hypothetical protein
LQTLTAAESALNLEYNVNLVNFVNMKRDSMSESIDPEGRGSDPLSPTANPTFPRYRLEKRCFDRISSGNKRTGGFEHPTPLRV